MLCPNCKNKLESENCGLVISSIDLAKHPTGLKICAATHYYCTVCDSEWSWILGVKGLRKLDGGRNSEIT